MNNVINDSILLCTHSGSTLCCILHLIGEVREAVLSLLSCKEELDAEIRSLKRLLDQGQEENAELKAALAETNRQHNDKVERLENRIQALVR